MNLSDFCVWDTETTGTNSINDRITEIAAVRVVGGEIVGRIQVLINHPEVTYINPKVVDITGITVEMCRACGISEKDALNIFALFVGGSLLVAHNAAFDARMTTAAYERVSGGKRKLTNPLLCSLTAARQRLPGAPNHQLPTLARHLNLTAHTAHRALGDVLTTTELILALHQMSPVEELINRIGFPGWVKGGVEAPVPHVSMFAQ